MITTQRSDSRGETVTSETGATRPRVPLTTQKVTSLNWPGVRNRRWISRTSSTLSTGKSVENSRRSARHPRGPVPGPPCPHGLPHSNGNLTQFTPTPLRLLRSERELPSTLQRKARAVTPGVTDVGLTKERFAQEPMSSSVLLLERSGPLLPPGKTRVYFSGDALSPICFLLSSHLPSK